MVNTFVEDVFGGRPQPLYRKIAVKFLMARKWEMDRAKDLYNSYRVSPYSTQIIRTTDRDAGKGEFSRSAPNRSI